MNSRERILTTLDHREPDRCATYIWIRGEALQQLMRHLEVNNQDELERRLGIDRWRKIGLAYELPPDHEERITRFVPEEFREREEFKIEQDGRVMRVHDDVDYLEDVVHYPLQDVTDPDELLKYPFPEQKQNEKVTDEHRLSVQQTKKSDAVVTARVVQPFKKTCQLRGMENTMCDMLINPDLMNAVYDRLYAYNTATSVALASTGVDVIEIVGDIAMQDRLMMSPELWRHFDKPRIEALIKAVKRTNPATKIYMHSDGKLTDIVPDLVEVGLDILNPVQPECMCPFETKRKWGDRLVLHGAVSMQHTLPFGSADDVREVVHRLVAECGAGGGFVLGPANMILPEFPVENVVAMYEAAGDL